MTTFFEVINAFLQVSVLEWFCILFTIGCVMLAGINSIHTWWVGLVGAVLYGTLFYKFNLYADATLQLFFFVTGVIGWYNWKNKQDSSIEMTDTFSDLTLLKYTGVAMVVASMYGWLLHTFTDAYAPMIDSLVLTFSVLAQFLLMLRKRKTWLIWIFVNTISVPLFWSRELYPTAIMYSLFWCHAWWAYFNWNSEYNKTIEK